MHIGCVCTRVYIYRNKLYTSKVCVAFSYDVFVFIIIHTNNEPKASELQVQNYD